MSNQPSTGQPTEPPTSDLRPPTSVRINADRLHESLRQLCQIGATPGGGVTRLALSDAEDAAHELAAGWMEEAGLRVMLIRLDRRGTLDSALPAESRTRLLNDLGAQVAELSTLAAELTDLARGDVSDESTEPRDAPSG